MLDTWAKQKERISRIASRKFFENVKTNNPVSQSFEQVLQERLKEKGLDNIKDLLVDIFLNKKILAKTENDVKKNINWL